MLEVTLRGQTPSVDGKLEDWAGAAWVDIDKSGVAANFNSNSKPYDITAALTIAGDRLYAAYRTGDAKLLQNSGEVPNAPFKTGGALDLMLGTNPAADPKRTTPVEGDLRLLVTLVKGQPKAVLYRAVVPGTKEPVPFSSPWRTITLDRVDDVSAEVQLAGAGGNYEFSIPLATLGLKPKAGTSLKGDIGILRGSGTADDRPRLLEQQGHRHHLRRALRGRSHPAALGPCGDQSREVISPVFLKRLPVDR